MGVVFFSLFIIVVQIYLPLNFVPIAPSNGSSICTCIELSPVTSTITEAGASGGLAWSQPNSRRRKPLTRLSHMPICLSTSLPVQPVTEEPVLPKIIKKIYKEIYKRIKDYIGIPLMFVKTIIVKFTLFNWYFHNFWDDVSHLCSCYRYVEVLNRL